MTNLRPARLITPGDILCAELDARQWTCARLATLTGIPYPVLRGIAYHAMPISEHTAIALSDALGTSVELWLNLQANYDREQGSQS